MFCTSLRRRLSFASGVQSISKAPLYLKESQLKTHDIEITIENAVDQRTGSITSSRVLRVLLLSRSAVSDLKLKETLDRIQHFSPLTGGQDLVIVFLLSAPKDTSFTSAKELTRNTISDAAEEDAIVAYSRLQAEMVNLAEIPYIPIRPIITMNELPTTIEKHVAASKAQPPKAKPSSTPFELLKLCTANPPMSESTAYIISEIFADLKDLSSACSVISSAPNSSSPSARASAFQSSQIYDFDTVLSTQSTGSDAARKLKRLRDLVGEQECQDIIDFWKEEWLL